MWVQSLDQDNPLEKGTATYSSILAWRIAWTEEPGGVYSPESHKESDTTEVTWDISYPHSSKELAKEAIFYSA